MSGSEQMPQIGELESPGLEATVRQSLKEQRMETPALFYESRRTLVPQPDEGSARKGHYRPILLNA